MGSLMSDGEIMAELGITCSPECSHSRHNQLTISPMPDVDAIQPASIDIRLGDLMLKQVKTGFGVRPDEPPTFNKLFTNIASGVILFPGEFYLGTTAETFRLGARTSLKLEGKSSWGRCGLEVHSTAGWIDPGFHGQITLEIKVVGVDPVTVKPGDYIAQVCVFRMDADAVRPYGDPSRNSKYNGQTGPTGPRATR